LIRRGMVKGIGFSTIPTRFFLVNSGESLMRREKMQNTDLLKSDLKINR
jgi:hypothetical protein